MYRTGEAESLLPVFGTILAFGPDELRECREGLQRLKEGEVSACMHLGGDLTYPWSCSCGLGQPCGVDMLGLSSPTTGGGNRFGG